MEATTCNKYSNYLASEVSPCSTKAPKPESPLVGMEKMVILNDISPHLRASHVDVLDEIGAEVFLLLPAFIAFMVFMLFLGRTLAEAFITDFFIRAALKSEAN